MTPHSKRFTKFFRHGRALTRRHRLQLILALRVTLGALGAYALAQALHLRLPLWAVLTSLIVTQMSLGRSLKVATDYLLGTFIGVGYGGALAKVRGVAFLGDTVECALQLDEVALVARMPSNLAPALDADVAIIVDQNEISMLPDQSGREKGRMQ